MAIRITRVYTRTGDRGETRLVGGKKVPKDTQRIEAYGTVDELNSIVGLVRAFGRERLGGGEVGFKLEEILKQVQNDLFDLGSELATPPDSYYEGMPRIGDPEVKRLEALIDECQKGLEPLRSFILPGGGVISAFLHQCRTVCRRAEREVLRLSREEEIGDGPIRYLNRLSDLFFALSRWIGRCLGEEEFLWERGLQGPPRKARRRRS